MTKLEARRLARDAYRHLCMTGRQTDGVRVDFELGLVYIGGHSIPIAKSWLGL